ncbi:DNA-binding response regulator [Geothrix oryzae]|uniref:DNA-binding response regulator n=1 Tax=Geothrix oryzae TaxID=2927975 RepID=A0ABN6V3B7_9BACT|nr:LytTR family DNA-binding domain-containing protein [Geothrix oryzae]BDU70793.1 DNA-binding response regulator [Geothrix oryzae]
MKPLRVALADDEPLARARLARLLREAGCEVKAELADGAAVLAWLREPKDVDALFLDIQMPGATGLEVAAELADGRQGPPVVFVTAHSEHAVRAFEAAAADYLLKPISADRLARTLARLREGAPRRAEAAPAPSPRFPVKAGEGHVFLDLRRTTHFEVEEEVVWAWAPAQGTPQRHRTAWTTLAEVEAAFPGVELVRIQRHLLLRPEAVLGLRPLEGGRAAVRVGEGLDLEVSRSVTPRLKERLGL